MNFDIGTFLSPEKSSLISGLLRIFFAESYSVLFIIPVSLTLGSFPAAFLAKFLPPLYAPPTPFPTPFNAPLPTCAPTCTALGAVNTAPPTFNTSFAQLYGSSGFTTPPALSTKSVITLLAIPLLYLDLQLHF